MADFNENLRQRIVTRDAIYKSLPSNNANILEYEILKLREYQ